jgi:hypothetical protein
MRIEGMHLILAGMRNGIILSLPLVVASLASCGGGASQSTPKTTADNNTSSSTSPSTSSTTTDGSSGPSDTSSTPSQEAAAAVHPCGDKDKVQNHDASSTEKTQAFSPCAETGGHDYSGMIEFENVPNGIRVIIHAKDDEFTALGPDVQSRDAVLVYPKGAGTQSVEIPLVKTADGYSGDKIILWSDLGDLSQDGGGQKMDIAVFDHDKSSGKPAEELHTSVAINSGDSCAKAATKYPQNPNAQQPDYDKLQATMQTTSWDQAVGACGVPNSTGINVCAAVKDGKVVGATIKLSPANAGMANCIDHATRALSFPSYGEPAQVKWVSKASH